MQNTENGLIIGLDQDSKNICRQEALKPVRVHNNTAHHNTLIPRLEVRMSAILRTLAKQEVRRENDVVENVDNLVSLDDSGSEDMAALSSVCRKRLLCRNWLPNVLHTRAVKLAVSMAAHKSCCCGYTRLSGWLNQRAVRNAAHKGCQDG